mgnify:FL=1
MHCSKCDVFTNSPSICIYCQLTLCIDHNLPENHNCSQFYRIPKSYGYQESNEHEKRIISVNSRFGNFSSEFKHLLIGMTLVLLVGISFFVGSTNTTYTPLSVLVLGIILMSSFLVHEMAHKFYALKKGYHAEFRLNNMGLF